MGPSGGRPSPNLIYSTRDGAQPPAPLVSRTAAAAAAAAAATRSHTTPTAERQARLLLNFGATILCEREVYITNIPHRAPCGL